MKNFRKEKEFYKVKNKYETPDDLPEKENFDQCQTSCPNKFKKTKESGFINVTDPSLRKQILETTKCPGDATNFTFWFNKNEPNNWGLTIKSIPKKSTPNEYERQHGMIFNSQHTWKITWFHDNGHLKVAQNSKSLAEDIVGSDFNAIEKIYSLYKIK